MKLHQILPGYQPVHTPLLRRTNALPRILVVDDDIYVRQVNSEALTYSGYEVDVAENGAAGWAALQAKPYDLLITDHSMPKVSGVELLQKIHAARLALPVIMATGVVPQKEFTRYPWLLPAAMLLKPFAVSDLLGTVKEVLRVTDIPPEQVWESEPAAYGWKV